MLTFTDFSTTLKRTGQASSKLHQRNLDNSLFSTKGGLEILKRSSNTENQQPSHSCFAFNEFYRTAIYLYRLRNEKLS